MSGMINWKDDSTPMYSHNQPPLFFYLLAFVISITGTGEIPLHLFLSIFTFLTLLLFNRLTEVLNLKNTTLLLLLFAFSPALVVNQNLMTDIPVLVVILASALFLLKARQKDKFTSYIITAFLLSIGLLIKYSILPLLIVLLLVILIRRDYKYLFTLFIPIGILVLWSVWNYAEYGSIHFLDRPRGEIHINRLWSFMACTGAVAFFSASILSGSFTKPWVRKGIIIVLILFLLQIVLFANRLIPEKTNTNLLNILFIINGILVYFLLVRQFIKNSKGTGFHSYLMSDSFIVLLFVASMAAFMVLFAPFMATRHILLVIPFVLLFSDGLFTRSGNTVNRISLGLSIVFGVTLGISDYTYANYYRKMANEIKTHSGQTVWTVGHWGWQWYAEKNGMKEYATNSSVVKDGDLMVYPGNISRQEFAPDLQLTVLEKKYDEAGFLTFFSGNNFASLYSSSMKIPPWTLSLQPIDTIYICRVHNLNN
jgi:4-amino-4-deoxy-L-arabinose transferase-like glycosyltransferase